MTLESKAPTPPAASPFLPPPPGALGMGPPTPPSMRFKREMPEAFSLIFLDIDGVLNSVKTAIVHGHYPFPASPRTWNPGDSLVEDPEAFDPLAIAMINKLCNSCNAYIVLSSTWRRGFDMDKIQLMMEEIGIDSKYILGRTDQEAGLRGDQVQRSFVVYDKGELDWINALKDKELMVKDVEFKVKPKIISYVIIDDNDEFHSFQKENFVHTTELDGLTLDKTLEAGITLSGNPYFHVKELQDKRKSKEDKGNGTIH